MMDLYIWPLEIKKIHQVPVLSKFTSQQKLEHAVKNLGRHSQLRYPNQVVESQNVLIWHGPIRIIESNPSPAQHTSRVTPWA